MSTRAEQLAHGLLCLLLWGGIAMADPPPSPHPASQPAQQQRPRICLVLSGGGARGAAHVGVLKALEELHIPVDCIAGTSLGASVGGLYAAGMTADELEVQLNRPSVQADMADNPPRYRLTYQMKQDQLKYLLRLEFGYANGRFFFPQGIINSNDPGRILNLLSLTLQPNTDFDKLPIPFRAVATDVETGDMVVLDHGSLAESMRASMAVPGLYPPVPIDGHLLVDGGLIRNLPVDVARKMGADIIIAVNIGTPLAKGDQLGDVVSLSLQVLKIPSNQNAESSIGMLTSRDVLLQPDMGDIGPTDFNRMGEAIRLGEQQARTLLEKYPMLQLPPDEYAAYVKARRQVPIAPVRVDFVTVEGNQKIPTDRILARFSVQPGTAWNLQAIDAGLRRIYDLGYFQSVDASLVTTDGQAGIRLSVKEKAWQPNYVQFGLHIADDFEGGSVYELLGDYTRAEINDMGAEWRNQFEIGNSRYLYSEFYQPVDYSGRFFVAPQAEYLNQTFDVFSGEDRIAEYSVVFPHAGLDFGVTFGNAGEARVGLIYGHVVAEPRIGDPAILPSYRNTLTGARLRLNLDTFDNISFPSTGSYLFVNGFFPRRALGSDINYNKLNTTFGQAFGSESDPVLFMAEAGSSLGTQLPPYEQFGLGGFLSLAGRRQGQLRGDRVLDAHLIYAHRASTLPTGLGKGLYLGAGLDAGNVWQDGQRADLGDVQYGASLFLGADTVLGPLYLGLGAGKGGRRTWFLYLGIPVNGGTQAPSFGN